MRPIPERMKAAMAADPYYQTCVHASEECAGRIEWDHVFTYAGRQLNEIWAILPTCHWHHVHIAQYRKESERIACSRATPEDLAKYPRRDWSAYH
jgi:hypothetical protein